MKKGIYNELININKAIRLIGEDKNTTIINFNPKVSITQVPILTVDADNCTIENLQITLGNRSIIAQGITIKSKNNTIKNTIITNVTNGIELTAYAESNTIIHNQITHNLIGINAINSLSNTISYNTLSHNTQYCIYFSSEADHNTISFNNLDSSSYGIRIKGSKQNYVYNNCITNNTKDGMYFCCGARENYFYNNTLINNTLNANENSGLRNVWYNAQSRLGNYWDDYNGSDENHDDIGDSPYNIPGAGNQDSYPLMTPPLDIPCNQ